MPVPLASKARGSRGVPVDCTCLLALARQLESGGGGGRSPASGRQLSAPAGVGGVSPPPPPHACRLQQGSAIRPRPLAWACLASSGRCCGQTRPPAPAGSVERAVTAATSASAFGSTSPPPPLQPLPLDRQVNLLHIQSRHFANCCFFAGCRGK